ncbi:MAG: hypothetical protein ABWX84_13985 [Nocardioides sp.]
MSWQSTPTWHLDEATLRAYVDGRPLTIVGASVESHLVDCPECRVRLGELMSHESVDQAWSAIRAHVEAPRPSVAERVLRWCGISADSARLLAAVPAFRGAWLLGVLVVTVFAGVAALFSGDTGLTLFLMVAPLIPVAGVAASFGGDADPAHELVTVTPYSSLRLLLVRTLGVLLSSLPVTVLVGVILPGPIWLGIAWLTPALAGVTLVLLLAPILGTSVPAAAIGACWSLAVVSAARMHDPAAVVEPAMQLVLAGVLVVAGTALVLRYPSLDHLGSHS